MEPEVCGISGFYIALKMDDILTSTNRKQRDRMKRNLLGTLSRYNKCFEQEDYDNIMKTIENIELYNINNVRTNSPLNDIFNSIHIY